MVQVPITGAGIAQLVERSTEKAGTVLTWVQVPSAARDFFSQSQLQAQTLIQCLYSTPCAIAYINLTSVHMLKIPHWQPYRCLGTKILHTEILVIRMDNSNTALATAVPYPGKVARISHKHQ